MNIKSVRQPQKRIETPDYQQLGIIAYGDNNLYPQDMANIVASSESGTGCLETYSQFLQGDGFANTFLAELVVNTSAETLDDILQKISSDLASFNGFALHVNYNVWGKITEINHVPFEFCRLTPEDETGEIYKIAVHPDWNGTKKRGNKVLKVSKENIEYINRYNSNIDVILREIESAGDIENYKGQILWVSGAGTLEYPKTIYDAAITQLSIEEGIGNIAYKNARNGFNLGGMLTFKKGFNTDDATNNINYDNLSIAEKAEQRQIGEAKGLEQIIADSANDLATSNIIVCEVESDEEIPQFMPFRTTNYDKEFTVTTQTACEKIYATFGQEAFYRMRTGAVGFSSDLIQDAYNLYNEKTKNKRRMIERAFAKIFKHWTHSIPSNDFSIIPLKFSSDEKNNNP